MNSEAGQMQGVFDALEVILFSTAEPISAYQLAQMIGEEGLWPEDGVPTPGRMERLVAEMLEAWEASSRPLTVLRIAGGYQMASLPEWAGLVARLMEDRRSHRLSRAALETLAIVAYRQPVIRPDIDAIRGVNSDSALKTLLERDLVAIAGRDEGPGRPLLYKTTTAFLKYFGLDTVADLPDQDELLAILGAERPRPIEGHQPELSLVDRPPEAVGDEESELVEEITDEADPEGEEPMEADPEGEEPMEADPEGEEPSEADSEGEEPIEADSEGEEPIEADPAVEPAP